jgi:hypothetical protein
MIPRNPHLVVALSGLIWLVACGVGDTSRRDPPTPHPSTEQAFGTPTPANVIDQVRVRADLAAMRQHVKNVRAAEGTSPPRRELETLGTSYRLGEEYDYDERTGEILSRTYPDF